MKKAIEILGNEFLLQAICSFKNAIDHHIAKKRIIGYKTYDNLDLAGGKYFFKVTISVGL